MASYIQTYDQYLHNYDFVIKIILHLNHQMVPPTQLRYHKRPHVRDLDLWVRQCFLPKTFWRIYFRFFLFKKRKKVTILALRWSVQNCAENTGRASSNTERRIQNWGHHGQNFRKTVQKLWCLLFVWSIDMIQCNSLKNIYFRLNMVKVKIISKVFLLF